MSENGGGGATFEAISPVFPVSDVAAALSFYREQLGFAIGWTWAEPPTHANVCRGAVAINLTLKPSDAGNAEAYVELRGIDAYYAELQRRGVRVGELDDRPYGMRDFALADPDGNRLVFGEPIR